MADITMCTTTDCPLQGFCYRKQATPKEYWQSYTTFVYTKKWDSFDKDFVIECDHYIPVNLEDKQHENQRKTSNTRS